KTAQFSPSGHARQKPKLTRTDIGSAASWCAAHVIRKGHKPSRPCENSAWRDSQTAGAILESGMAHISGFERDQLLLLPEAVDDYVGSDNPVRFIDAFVDGLDLVGAGFGRVQPKATGRPGYAPGDLLKLYIYGYLNRVRSS